MRRSLTVTPENDKKILLTKGRFLTGDAPFDIDYTTMVNIFIELGHKLMTAAWNDSANPKVSHRQKRNHQNPSKNTSSVPNSKKKQSETKSPKSYSEN